MQSTRLPTWIASVIAAIVFTVDLWINLGMASGVLYLFAIWMTSTTGSRRDVWILTAACSALTLLGLAWHSVDDSWPQETVHRILALVAIVSTAILCVRAPQFSNQQKQGPFSPKQQSSNTEHEPLENARKVRAIANVMEDLRIEQEKLAASEQRIRSVIEFAPTAMVMINATGRMVLVNAEMEKLFDYARDELMNQPVEMLVPDRFRDSHPSLRDGFFAKPAARAMGEGRDLYAVRRDGSEFPVEIGLNPIWTNEGLCVLAAIVDITERKRSSERLRLAVEAAPNGMIMVESSGRIVLVNTAIEQMFGYARDELMDQPVEILVPDRFRDSHPSLRDGFFAKPAARAMGEGRDLYAIRKDGSEFPVEIGLNPIWTNEGLCVLAAIVDITERKQAEKRLLAFAEDLQRTNQELDEFAYVASHDLKAPLRGIDSLAQWLNDDLGEDLSGDSRRHLEQLQQRVRRMEGLLDDLLQYSRAGRVHGAMVDVDTAALIHELKDMLAIPEGFEIQVVEPIPNLRTLRVPLEQVFRNLIHNAVKHHDRPIGHVEISARDTGAFWSFTVSDDGPGIDPSYHDRVFRKFQTLKPRDEVEGSGMGLAVIKKIVESYGGAILLKSDGKRGSQFTFTWPKHIHLKKEASA